MATPIVAPLTGTVTTTAFVGANLPTSAAPGLALPSGKQFYYEIMLPSQYSTNYLWPLMIWLHPDGSGNNWYQRGIGNISVNDAAPQYQNVAYQRAYPSICIVPYADQSTASSTLQNWGGWINTGGTGNASTFNGETGPNTYALNFLVQYLLTQYSIDPARVYVNGFSLGGIGAEYLMLRYNKVNGNPKLYTAGTSTGGVMEIHGYGSGPSAADVTAMAQVPVWWISGQNDGTSIPADWNLPMWRNQSGNSSYPAYQSSVAASTAGNTQMRMWYVSGVGHSPTDGSGRYMQANTTVLDWLFSQGVSTTVALPVPTIASAVGYNTQTFGPTIKMGTDPTLNQLDGNWLPFSFYGTTWNNPPGAGVTTNSDGTITLAPNPLNNYGAQISSAGIHFPTGTKADSPYIRGVAFGGGAYFECTMSFNYIYNAGGPAFWMNDIENMAASSAGGDLTPRQWPGQATGFCNWIEVDMAEFDNGLGGSGMGFGMHNWWGNAGPGQEISGDAVPSGSPAVLGSSFDFTKPHQYGFLWVPATSTARGYGKYYVDRVQVGTTFVWDKYDPTGHPPPPTYPGQAFSVLDTRHMALIIGTGSSTAATVYAVSVWQASAVNNVTIGAFTPTGSGGGSGSTGGGGAVTTGTGAFQISNGQIIDPNGYAYLAAGINVYVDVLSSAITNDACQPLTTLFAGLNQVRIVFRNSWDQSSSTIAAINRLTALKIVVVLDDHVLGNSAATATGSTLTQELAWFTFMANTFKTNPYVWFQTQNEPGAGTNLAGLAQHEVDTYNAVRNTGNTSIVVMELPSGGNKTLIGTAAVGYDGKGPMTPSAYSTMRNIIWDFHFYDYITTPSYSADIPTIKAALLGSVSSASGTAAAQSVRSADGLVPVIVGEFGPSTSGTGGQDGGGPNLVATVMTSGLSFSAFTWYPGYYSDNNLTSNASGTLTTYGQQVAAGIAVAAANRATTTTFTPSANNTVILAGSSAVITDGNGTKWGIVGGQVTRNGTTDTTTSNVTKLAYVSGVVWQLNATGNWYSNVNGVWTGPTTVSPLPAVSASGSSITAPTTTVLTDSNFNSWGISTTGNLTKNGTVVSTPGGASVVLTPTSGGSVTDSAGHVWTLNSSTVMFEDGNQVAGSNGTGAVTVYNGTMYAQDINSKAWYTWNGTTFVAASAPPSTSLAVVVVAYVNSLIWEKDSANNWYSTSVTGTPVWTGPTTVSPISVVPGGISYILPMFQAGLRVITYIKQETPTSFTSGLASLRAEQSARHDIFMYEGCQEPDTANFVGTPETLANAASFQQNVWAAGQSDGLPVIQTSFGLAADYGTTGNLAAFATYGNAHTYPGVLNCSPNDGPSPGFISTQTTNALLSSPGRPIVHSEFGWKADHNGATAIASYVLDFIMSAYFDGNLPYYIVNGLYDDATGQWGLFNADQSPRLVATALTNFFALLKDSAANAMTFGPGKLNIAISNLPTGTNANMGGKFGVLQKADGSFWVLVRNEQTLTTSDANNHTAITVAPISCTVTLGTLATSIAVYDPLISATTPTQTGNNTSSITISVPAHPILIKIVRP